MYLEDWEKDMSIKFMADPALLQVYYYLHTIARHNGMVVTTLRELEIGTGLDKMKVKRRLDHLAVEMMISIVKSDRRGTVLIVNNSAYPEEGKALRQHYREEIKQQQDESFKRFDPEGYVEVKQQVAETLGSLANLAK